MRRTLWVLAALLCAHAAAADGGRVRIRQESGPFLVTVFTAPEPLVAGPGDVSVLVQDRATGEVRLDAEVAIRLLPPGTSEERVIAALPGTNRLLESAAAELTEGDWGLEVAVRQAGGAARVACRLPVAAARPRLGAVWPLVALPPVGVALCALRGAIRRRRKQ